MFVRCLNFLVRKYYRHTYCIWIQICMYKLCLWISFPDHCWHFILKELLFVYTFKTIPDMNHSGWTAFCCTMLLKKFNKSMLQIKSMDSNFNKRIKTSREIFLCHSFDNPSTAAWTRYQGTILWQTVVVTYSTSTLAFWLSAIMWFWGKSSTLTISCSSLQTRFGTHELDSYQGKINQKLQYRCTTIVLEPLMGT